MSNILISKKLFIELVKYHVLDIHDSEVYIKEELELKVDKLVRHEKYTQMRACADPAEKRKLLCEYLQNK